VVLKPRSASALAAFVSAVSTPGNALYRQYLDKGQFASEFGPTAATVDAVRAALSAQGLQVSTTTTGYLTLEASGTPAEVDSALGTTVASFRLPSGADVDANVTPARLSAAIAPSVQSVVGLDGFVKYGPELSSTSPARDGGAKASSLLGTSACSAATATGGWTAPQIAQAYGFDPLYAAGDNGAGRAIDLVEFAPFNNADITGYQSCYKTSVPVTVENVDGGPTGATNIEPEADIEDVVGLAPKLADVYVYQAPNTGTGDIDLLSAIAGADNARAVSTSWGACEVSSNAIAELPYFEMMAAQGQSVYADAGDSGSASCTSNNLNVADPSSDPYVTGVGGTDLNAAQNPPALAPSETAWVHGGGGISSIWNMPTWQLASTPGVINKYSTNVTCGAPKGTDCREVPDVSTNAGVGYALLLGQPGNWSGNIGGTSLATPIWAAMTTLIDDASSSCQAHPIGFVNPALYKYAAGSPADFNDITVGNNANGNPALKGHYPATKGYDMATGLGTPEAANLAQSFCGVSMWTQQTTAPSVILTDSPSAATSGRTLYTVSVNTGAGTSDIYYQTFNGVSWSPVSKVEPGGTPATTDLSPAIAVSGGKPIVAWTDPATGDVDASTLSGGAWSSPVVVGAGKALSSAGPALTAGGGGLVFAVWKGKSGDSVWMSIYSSGSWGAQQVVTGASSISRPTVTYYSPLAATLIGWTTSANKIQYEIFSLFGFGGVETIPGASNASPALTVVNGSQVFAAWKGTTLGKLYYSSLPPKKLTGTWSAQQTVPQALTDDSPALAAAGPTLYALWTGQSTSPTHLYYSVSDPRS